MRSRIASLEPGESLLLRNQKCSCVWATTYSLKRDTGKVFSARKAGPSTLRVTRIDGVPHTK
ncbi:MAG: hypothetical protein WCS67_01575 [Bacteroidales bacterium]